MELWKAREWEELRQLVKQMRDALVVDAAVKLRHQDRIKEHQEWLRQNELATARHHEFIAPHEAMMARIEEDLRLLEQMIIRNRSTNGNQAQ
jgi:collagenase-like PrtC family protease